MLGLVLETFTCLDETTLPKLFTTMVGSHLEYGNVILHPRFRGDKLEIEKIERGATRMMPRLKGLSYGEKLRRLILASLEQYCKSRRIDMLHVYKILNGINIIDPSMFFTMMTLEHKGAQSKDG